MILGTVVRSVLTRFGGLIKMDNSTLEETEIMDKKESKRSLKLVVRLDYDAFMKNRGIDHSEKYLKQVEETAMSVFVNTMIKNTPEINTVVATIEEMKEIKYNDFVPSSKMNCVHSFGYTKRDTEESNE